MKTPLQKASIVWLVLAVRFAVNGLSAEPLITLRGTDFQDGANQTFGTEIGGRADVNYVYAQPTAALATMQASVELKSVPEEQMCLLLDAKDNDGPRVCRIEISLNETVLLSGPNGFPKDWQIRSFDISKGTLKPGRNTVTIRNLEETGTAGMPPWFMVSRCAVGPAGCSLPKLVRFRRFAVHPQLASPRPLDARQPADLEAYYQHFAWAQEQGVKWFSISLDDVSWGERGPAAGGAEHARLVNVIFRRLRLKDKEAQMIFCPVAYWGDGTKEEDRQYLEALAREMHPDVYVFWTGNEVVPARMTAQAARAFKSTVRHRLIIWENYPVNDASPTMHLGPITGREPELARIADGYMSNPLCPQNQINRIPLLTCADFAWNPYGYDPDRSIGQALLRWGTTVEQRQVLKELASS